MKPLYNYTRAQRLAMVQRWAGRYVTVMHAPQRSRTPVLIKLTGRCLTAAVLSHGTTSDVIVIARPGDYPLAISLAQVWSIGPLT